MQVIFIYEVLVTLNLIRRFILELLVIKFKIGYANVVYESYKIDIIGKKNLLVTCYLNNLLIKILFFIIII